LGNFKEIDHFEDTGVDRRITLTSFLGMQLVRAVTALDKIV
jgi:hypothetical protein